MIPPLPHKYLGSERKRREETQGTSICGTGLGMGRTIRPKILADFFSTGVFRCREAYLASPLPRESFGSPSTLNFEKVTYLLWQFQGGKEKVSPQRDLQKWLVWSGEAALRSVVWLHMGMRRAAHLSPCCVSSGAAWRSTFLWKPFPHRSHPKGLKPVCACGCGWWGWSSGWMLATHLALVGLPHRDGRERASVSPW